MQILNDSKYAGGQSKPRIQEDHRGQPEVLVAQQTVLHRASGREASTQPGENDRDEAGVKLVVIYVYVL